MGAYLPYKPKTSKRTNKRTSRDRVIVTKNKSNVGRPTKYKKAYCQALLDHLKEGASIASFAASIDVARCTINEWASVHTEFSEALKAGKAKCAAWWETQLRRIALEGGGTGSSTAVIFGLKNMAAEDWRDKQDPKVTGRDGEPFQK